MAILQGIRFAKAFIELGLDATASQKQLRRFRNEMRSIRRVAFGVGGVLTAAFTPVAGILAKAVKEAARFEETASKLNVVFGKLTPQANSFVKTMERGLGQSRQEMAQFLSEFQDLLVPLGAPSQDAFALSQTLTKLAVDLGSFNNKRTADVFNDLTSALTGSSEVMKKYGVVVNETAVKQELLNNNLDPKRATEYQKALARVHLIMRSTQAAQGDAARTAGSLSNQWKAFQNQTQNTLIDMGQTLLPAVTEALTEIVGLAEKLTPAFKSAAGIVGQLARELQGVGEVFGRGQEQQLNRAVGARNVFGEIGGRIAQIGGVPGYGGPLAALRSTGSLQREAGLRAMGRINSSLESPTPGRPDVDAPGLPGIPTGKTPGVNPLESKLFMRSFRNVNVAIGRAIGQGAGIASDVGLTGRTIPDIVSQVVGNIDAVKRAEETFSVSGFGGDFVGRSNISVVDIQKDILETNKDMLQWMKDNAVAFS